MQAPSTLKPTPATSVAGLKPQSQIEPVGSGLHHSIKSSEDQFDINRFTQKLRELSQTAGKSDGSGSNKKLSRMSSPEQKLINITTKIEENLNRTRSSNSKDLQNTLTASKESFDLGGEYSYEKIKQKYAYAQVDALSQSISSDLHNDDWKKKLERMKQDFDQDNAMKRIEVEESNQALDIHKIIRKYGGGEKDHSWAYELDNHVDRQKPSYLSEHDTESVMSSAALGQQDDAY